MIRTPFRTQDGRVVYLSDTGEDIDENGRTIVPDEIDWDSPNWTNAHKEMNGK